MRRQLYQCSVSIVSNSVTLVNYNIIPSKPYILYSQLQSVRKTTQTKAHRLQKYTHIFRKSSGCDIAHPADKSYLKTSRLVKLPV